MIWQLELIAYLACFLISAGLYLLLTRFKAVAVLIGLELMTNGLALLFIILSLNDADYNGGLMVLFLLSLSAVNLGILLSILITLYKQHKPSEPQKIIQFKG